MTQLTINIENPAVLPSLKKLLSFIDGVSIAKPVRTRKTRLQRAIEEAEKGATFRTNDIDELMAHLME